MKFRIWGPMHIDKRNNYILCNCIAALVSLSTLFVFRLTDLISAHFAAAFDIPTQNISVYFSKLFSFRSLLNTLGAILFLSFEAFKKNSLKYRRHFSVGSGFGLLLSRFIFLILLYTSKQLGFDIYVILSIEAFFFGAFLNSFLTIAPEHTVSISLAVNASRLFVFLVQLVLDRVWYENRLLMIKIQSWICLLLTLITSFLWVYYNFVLSTSKDEEVTEEEVKITRPFLDTLKDAFSPFMMLFVASMFRDFLYPGVLPYALLERDQCHPVNMMVAILNMIGPGTLFVLDIIKKFRRWDRRYNLFWILAFPMLVVYILTTLAIHTKFVLTRAIPNSSGRVLVMTLIVVFCFGFLEPLSYNGVAKVVKPDSAVEDQQESTEDIENGQKPSTVKQIEGNDRVIMLHTIVVCFVRFAFAKLAVGYNDTRVSLGYYLPDFEPNHTMDGWNTFWHIFGTTFSIAFKDTWNDFNLNIKKYL